MPVPSEVWMCLIAPVPIEGHPVDAQNNPIVGREIAKTRPVIVLAVFPEQEVASVVPITNGGEDIANAATVVELGQLTLNTGRVITGKALVHQIRSVSYQRLDECLGRLQANSTKMFEIKNSLRVYLNIP